MTSALTVAPERGAKDRAAFLELPYRLYCDHPVWVPPLRMAEAQRMDRAKNPFFLHGEAEHFLARRGSRVVGRIAAIRDPIHERTHGEPTGFFGFFDVEPDAEAARALVEAARSWTRERGLTPMRGPVCYSTNDVCGVLVDGFDEPPALMMPYNRPDYDDLLRGAGLAPAKDLLAFEIPTKPVPERLRRIVERRLQRSDIALRPVNLRRIDEEVHLLLDLYNRSWERNWGFVPATREEFEHSARDMAHVLDADLSAVAEQGGRAVGFSIVVKDVNRVLRGLDGRLLPFGWIRLLWRMRRIDHVRIVALGVVPEARGRGITEAFFVRAIEAAPRKGYVGGEAGWILEDNALMRSPIESVGGRVTKRYRLYEA
jgi:GNAT superfamily N-acetyltransferase